jgi:hypothetical protein
VTAGPAATPRSSLRRGPALRADRGGCRARSVLVVRSALRGALGIEGVGGARAGRGFVGDGGLCSCGAVHGSPVPCAAPHEHSALGGRFEALGIDRCAGAEVEREADDDEVPADPSGCGARPSRRSLGSVRRRSALRLAGDASFDAGATRLPPGAQSAVASPLSAERLTASCWRTLRRRGRAMVRPAADGPHRECRHAQGGWLSRRLLLQSGTARRQAWRPADRSRRAGSWSTRSRPLPRPEPGRLGLRCSSHRL